MINVKQLGCRAGFGRILLSKTTFTRMLFASLLLIISGVGSYAVADGLALKEIRTLKNPYTDEVSNPNLQDGSKKYLRLNGLNDRFDHCQSDGMNIFIAFARNIAVIKEAGGTITKFGAMKRWANSQNIDYPFDAKEIAGSSLKRVEKLAIEMAWKHPGSSESHLSNIGKIFWNECLQLPVEFFSAEWSE